MSNPLKVLLSVVIALSLVNLIVFLKSPSRPALLGSVAQGSEYQSTSTPVVANNFPALAQLCSTPGTFGSYIISKTDTGVITFYDATTSDVNKRASTMSTSSIILASFPASPTAQQYTYDSIVRSGLLAVSTGPIASSTITYRCN